MEQVRQLRQYIGVRYRFASFPLGDCFIRVIQLHAEFRLRHTCSSAQIDQVARENELQFRSVHGSHLLRS